MATQNWRRKPVAMSSRSPMTSAPMNNNPMGVQQTMSPVTPGIRPIAPTAPYSQPAPTPYSPPALPNGGGPPTTTGPSTQLAPRTTGGNVAVRPPAGPPAGQPQGLPGPVVTGPTVSPMPSRGMAQRFMQTPMGQAAVPYTAASPGGISPSATPKLNMAPIDSAVSPAPAPAAPAPPPMSPGLQAMQAMVERLRPGANNIQNLQQQTMGSLNRPVDRLRNDAAGVPNVIPQDRLRAYTGTHYVDGSGGLSPRIATPMGRNVLNGQPPDADTSMRPLNIPQTDYYGSRGIVPGSVPIRTDEDLQAARKMASGAGMAPDDFRVLTGGKAAITPQGAIDRVAANPRLGISGGNMTTEAGKQAVSATILNRQARRAGVRPADIQAWRQARSGGAMAPVANPAAGVAAGGLAGGFGFQPNQPMVQPDNQPSLSNNPGGGSPVMNFLRNWSKQYRPPVASR